MRFQTWGEREIPGTYWTKAINCYSYKCHLTVKKGSAWSQRVVWQATFEKFWSKFALGEI